MLTDNRAVGYIRVSSKGQVDGDGPERQEKAIRDFCAAHGLDCAWQFLEGGVSGTVEGFDRPQFAAMIQLCEREGIKKIVIERLDRIARDLMVQEFAVMECRKRGLQLFAADQGLVDVTDTDSDPTRKLIRQIMGALSEWERSMIVSKLAAARARKKAATGRCGGTIPWGTRAGETTIFDLAESLRDEGMSWREIARCLNEQNLPQRNGNPWTKGSVWSLLNQKRNESF